MKGEAFQQAVDACLFENSPDPVLLVDRDGVFLAVNRAAALYLGEAAQEIVGRRVTELFPADQAQRQLDVIRQVFTTGEPFLEERVTPIGELIFVFHYTVRRVEGVDGQPLAILGVIRDVTALAALEGRYAELYEKATDALFALDREGRLRIVNRQAEAMTGYRRDLVESLHFTQLLPPDEAERLSAYFEARVQGRDVPTQYELRYLHASGEERWAEVRISREPSTAGFYQASLRDVTPRKRLELMRRDFLHMVSHGLKAPLAVIQGYAGALAADRFGELKPEQRAPLQGMLESAVRMRRLMEQFLMAERVDADDGIDAVPGAAFDIVQDAVLSMQAEAEGRQIRVCTEADGCAGASVPDQEGFRCILENFLSNALKFTPAGGAVTVRATLEEGRLLLEVQDTGRGIPEAELLRIFERFYRAGGSSDTWGSGLGLYIVRRLVDRMEGRVAVDSRSGEGSCFRVWIPTANAPRS